jgi:hypothetical protein
MMSAAKFVRKRPCQRTPAAELCDTYSHKTRSQRHFAVAPGLPLSQGPDLLEEE